MNKEFRVGTFVLPVTCSISQGSDYLDGEGESEGDRYYRQ